MLNAKFVAFGGYRDQAAPNHAQSDPTDLTALAGSCVGPLYGAASKASRDQPVFDEQTGVSGSVRNSFDRAIEQFAPHPLRD